MVIFTGIPTVYTRRDWERYSSWNTDGQRNIVMPKLKIFDSESFSFPIGNKKIIFANNKGQQTYIKNRMDRMLTKEPETIKWINNFETDSVFFDIGANIGIYSLYSAVVKAIPSMRSNHTPLVIKIY